jgi:hypothetical protein
LRAALALVLASACVQRVRLDDADVRAPGLPPSVRCATADGVVELDGWPGAVLGALHAGHRSGARELDGARLTCRTVVVDSRPVVSGSNRPMVMMADVTELEVQVELWWRTTDPRTCIAQRWLGRSLWRVVPAEPELPDALTAAVRAALTDAVSTAQLAQESRAPCPAGL